MVSGVGEALVINSDVSEAIVINSDVDETFVIVGGKEAVARTESVDDGVEELSDACIDPVIMADDTVTVQVVQGPTAMSAHPASFFRFTVSIDHLM